MRKLALQPCLNNAGLVERMAYDFLRGIMNSLYLDDAFFTRGMLNSCCIMSFLLDIAVILSRPVLMQPTGAGLPFAKTDRKEAICSLI